MMDQKNIFQPSVLRINGFFSKNTITNIDGFSIGGGEKIVSIQYMGDTAIIVKQNRCFKEVELSPYEEGSEAKGIYSKHMVCGLEFGKEEVSHLWRTSMV